MERLIKYLDNTKPEKTQKALNAFRDFYKELVIWNNKFNLTAITDKEQVISKHFEDSLAGLQYFSGKVCDIGSGAGFPSVPLAIANENLEFVLIDSVNKKVGFLNYIIDKLKLNAKAFHVRAEDAAKDYRECFDTVTARAVAPLSTLVEYLLPLLKVGGTAVIYKGEAESEIEEAANAIKLLGGETIKIVKYTIFDTLNNATINHSIILIKKVKPTPKEFPRSGNKPRLIPLK